MTDPKSRFEDFAVGDYVSLRRRFSAEDFEAFSRLSGDRNPLHHDVDYATASEFGRTIVPLHLIAAPLSMIAGMMIPGEPALYLDHKLRAVRPVFYGDEITYSARVIATNRSHRILTLRVIAFRDRTVVLDGEMRVQVREQAWRSTPPVEIANAVTEKLAVVTGAAGAIGSAISLGLAKAGWGLVLHYRSDPAKAEALGEACEREGVKVELVKGSLSTAKDHARLAERLTRDVDRQPTALVHAASPPIDAKLDELAAVNYTALAELTDAMLPGMLRRQQGAVVLIGSSALETAPPGWEHYVAAKSMALSLVNTIHRNYAAYGVTGLTVALGYVRTAFSKPHRAASAATLLPEEVAETVVACLADPAGAGGTYLVLEPNRLRRGSFGFRDAMHAASPSAVADPASATATAGAEPAAQGDAQDLTRLIHRFFRLDSGTDLREGGLGLTPGWDSLRQIELLLTIERDFGISFDSAEIDRTYHYADLEALWRQKMAAREDSSRPLE